MAYQLDPSGDDALRLAKHVRRDALRAGGSERVREEANRRFGLPAASLGHASALVVPLYDIKRATSS